MKSQLNNPAGNEIPLRGLVENFSRDRVIIDDSTRLLLKINAIKAKVLLLGGTKSMDYFGQVLSSLQKIIPAAGRTNLNGLVMVSVWQLVAFLLRTAEIKSLSEG